MANQPVDLGTLLNFIRQPAARATPPESLSSLMSMVKPDPTQAAISRQEREMTQAGKLFPSIAGHPAQDVNVPYKQGNDQTFPGEAPIQGLQTTQHQPGTGMYNTQIPLEQRIAMVNQKMIESGNPILQKQGLSNLAQVQQSQIANAAKQQLAEYKYNHPGLSNAAKMLEEMGIYPGTQEFNDRMTKYMNKSNFEQSLDKPIGTQQLPFWTKVMPDGTRVHINYLTPRMIQQGIGKGPGGRDLYENQKMKSSQTAGMQAQMIVSQNRYHDSVLNNLYTTGPDGKKHIDDKLLWGMAATNIFGRGMLNKAAIGAAGLLEGKKYATKLGNINTGYDVIKSAILRLETGAQMHPSEVEDVINRYQPSPFLPDDVNDMKVKALGDFLKNANRLLDPANPYNHGLKGIALVNHALKAEEKKYGVPDKYLNGSGLNKAQKEAILKLPPNKRKAYMQHYFNKGAH